MPDSTAFSYLSGFVQDRRLFRVICQNDILKQHGYSKSRLMKWVRAERTWYRFDIEWHATRLCVQPQPVVRVFAAGPDGMVLIAPPGAVNQGEIDATDDGPKRRGPIRDLRLIGTEVYVTGMGRQVYRYARQQTWVREDAGVVQARGMKTICGFNSIDGLSPREIYAVGFNGEIWLRRHNDWSQLDSPTNAVLHRVRVIRSDLVFVSGQLGLLLQGHENEWVPINHDTLDQDLWGMEWFRGQLYVACDLGLYRLETDDRLARVRSVPDGATFRHLHAADGVLLSSGPSHVLFTEDGEVWEDITPS